MTTDDDIAWSAGFASDEEKARFECDARERAMTAGALAPLVPPARGGGDFSIGSPVWPGTSKLLEEMGELQQVLGKLIAVHGGTEHWDGKGDLRDRLVEEIGDVYAALDFFQSSNLTKKEQDDVCAREIKKRKLFQQWHADHSKPARAMRSQDEIAAHLREKDDDLFGFKIDVLLPHLDYARAREFIKTNVTREEWEKKYPLSETDSMLAFREYAQFAWSKTNNHRGLSASRSIAKLSVWAWLFGRDDVLAQVERTSYPMYGCPKLRVICEAFGFPVPADEETQRMARGEPCRPDCEDGCGS